MKTTGNKSPGFFLIFFMLFILGAKAEDSNSQPNTIGEISKDSLTSVFIIGGVLLFGISFYIIYSIMEKKSKVDEKPTAIKPIYHKRHHHHGGMIKKIDLE